jgi:putative flavoprotein involved in K+ transport
MEVELIGQPDQVKILDAIVIGAGHAGLAASYRLQEAGLDHVILERGEVGETWRSQRWDAVKRGRRPRETRPTC